MKHSAVDRYCPQTVFTPQEAIREAVAAPQPPAGQASTVRRDTDVIHKALSQAMRHNPTPEIAAAFLGLARIEAYSSSLLASLEAVSDRLEFVAPVEIDSSESLTIVARARKAISEAKR